jgi:polyisoprenyl-teichoic acid--peptidoglycan teichoic acid transferase
VATDSNASRSGPSAPLAALFSAVLPGWGHAYIGQNRIAFGLYLIDVLVVASLLVMVARFQLEVVKMWVSPEALLVLIGVNIVGLVFRAVVIAGSYSAAPSGSLRGWGGAALALALALLVLPHLGFGYIAWTQYDLIKTVFPGNGGPIASPTTTTTDPSPTTTLSGATTTTAPTTTTTAPPPIWDGLDRLNLVLLGADAGVGRTGVRTDTMIVVSIDPESGNIAMFSVPRQLSNPPLPPGMGIWDCQCLPDLITHLYDAAERYPDAFPGPASPPINAIKGSLSEIFGIPIHYYAMVTLDGFVGIIDALGGVTMDVPKTIVDETYPHEDGTVVRVVIEAGRQHLDGHLALAYSRIRRHSDDFARMHRQRCVLGAVVDQASPLTLLRNFGSIAQAIKDHVSTDIPQDKLVDFVDLLPRVSTDRIYSLRITRDEYATGTAPGRVFYDIPRIRADAHDLMEDPVAALERLGMDPLDATCDQSFD